MARDVRLTSGGRVLFPDAGVTKAHVFADNPGIVTTEWLKRKREGVLLDHRQNGHGKTLASVYSPRPKPAASVSTPLRWEELTEDVLPERFTTAVVLERLSEHGDLFAPTLAGGQSLGAAAKRLG